MFNLTSIYHLPLLLEIVVRTVFHPAGLPVTVSPPLLNVMPLAAASDALQADFAIDAYCAVIVSAPAVKRAVSPLLTAFAVASAPEPRKLPALSASQVPKCVIVPQAAVAAA